MYADAGETFVVPIQLSEEYASWFKVQFICLLFMSI